MVRCSGGTPVIPVPRPKSNRSRLDSTRRETSEARLAPRNKSGSVPSANSNPTNPPGMRKGQASIASQPNDPSPTGPPHPRPLRSREPSRAPGGPSPGAPGHQLTNQPSCPGATPLLAPAGARAPSPPWRARGQTLGAGARLLSLPPYNHLPAPVASPSSLRESSPPRALRLRPLYPATKNYQKKIRNPQIREIYQYRATYQPDC